MNKMNVSTCLQIAGLVVNEILHFPCRPDIATLLKHPLHVIVTIIPLPISVYQVVAQDERTLNKVVVVRIVVVT